MNTVTTMLGMTDASDQGMNLLQTIISTVLGWDISELKKRSSKIEKGSDAPSKAQLETIRAYVGKSRDEHDKCRTESGKLVDYPQHSTLDDLPKLALQRSMRSQS